MVEMAKNGGSHRVTTQSMGEVPGSRLFRAKEKEGPFLFEPEKRTDDGQFIWPIILSIFSIPYQ